MSRRTPLYTPRVPTDPLEVGRNVKAEREKAGLSLAKLSAVTGISKAHLVRLERGEGNPSLGILSRIADAFELTVADLVGRPKLTYRPEEGDDIDSTLRAFADGADLTSSEVNTLASIRFRAGERPKTIKRWRYIYDSLVASESFDRQADDD